MIKRCIVVLSALFLLSSPVMGGDWGTFVVGAKTWYTFWDSGALDWYGKQLSANFDAWGIPISVNTETGTGYLAGPMFGYMSKDGKWNVSFAPMMVSDFSQNQDITVLSGGSSSDTMTVDIDLEREDYDLAVSYSLTGLEDKVSFFRYCKLFAGLKYQTVKFDMVARRYTDGVFDGTQLNSYMDYSTLMPTVGFGVAYPVTQKVVLSGQAGIGMVFIDEKKTVYNGYRYDLDPDDSVAYNAEAGVNILPMDKLIVQLGYRYQQWTFKPKNEIGTYPSDSCTDVNQGPSLSVVYTF
jgi:opacity protein-like surface antigen